MVKTKQKSAEETLKPDIIITVSGAEQSGKTKVMDQIAKRLKGLPLGYDVYRQESDTLIDSYMRIHKDDLGTAPEWDGNVRKVLIREEVK